MQRRTNIPKKKFSNKLSRQFTTSSYVTELSVLGMLFQGNCRFTQHISGKLSKLNKCLYIITILRKEGTAQVEVDKLFETIVLPNILYGITVYGASEADLNSVQMFLDRCNKRKYTSTKMSERKLLENGDTKLFRKMKDKIFYMIFYPMPKNILPCPIIFLWQQQGLTKDFKRIVQIHT